LHMSNSNASNSTGSITKSYWLGLYTKNASSLSLLSSVSRTYAWQFHGTVSSWSLNSGHRILTADIAGSLPAGDYWAAQIDRTTSGGANATVVNMVLSNFAPASTVFNGMMGVAPSNTLQPKLGQGMYSVSTTGLPSAIAFSEITAAGSMVFRPAIFRFVNGTV
jgi:hypothetical protein